MSRNNTVKPQECDQDSVASSLSLAAPAAKKSAQEQRDINSALSMRQKHSPAFCMICQKNNEKKQVWQNELSKKPFSVSRM
ncbi:MAG: hypothetical protein NTZ67_05215 [Gammaproteobacteria bacterium]|nr:hypothetical protein [Gammaproteobacteria bacterium]